MGRFDYFNTAVLDKGRGLNQLYRSTKTHKNNHNYWKFELLTTFQFYSLTNRAST